MSAGIRPYHWSVPSAATKKNHQEKRRQKAETAAIIAAAGAGTVAATGASGKAVLDAADKGGQVATKTAGAMAVGATAATAVQIGTLMAALVAARGGMHRLSDMVKPDGKMSAEDICIVIDETKNHFMVHPDIVVLDYLQRIPRNSAFKSDERLGLIDTVQMFSDKMGDIDGSALALT